MAEALKYIYNDQFFRHLTSNLKAVLPAFKEKVFLSDIHNDIWAELELKQRMRHISAVIHRHIPGNYEEQLEIILALTDRLLQENPIQQSFPYLILADFVEQFGLQQLKASLRAMEKITQVTSCEYAIRPFLKADPEKVMKQMLKWSGHKNENVRRFSSEGCRPRLPWGMALHQFQQDPAPILPILENLKNDPSEYVRRSVANNLNDIAKDHPDLVLRIAQTWIGKTEATDRLVKHASRTLLKKGNTDVLKLFGHADDLAVAVNKLKLSAAAIAIGDNLSFTFQLSHSEKATAALRIEYAVYYKKARGHSQKKVFKITENSYEPGKAYEFVRNQSFRDLTTRRHHPGEHVISIIINGKELARKTFQLS